MTLRPFLLVLPCVFLAAIPARTNASQARPADFVDGNPAPGDSGSGNVGQGSSASGSRKLIPGTAFDGHFSLSLGFPVSEESGGMSSRGALLARWNPTFLGFNARVAAGSVFWEPLGSSGTSSGLHSRLRKWTLALDEAWFRYPVRAAGWTAAFQAGIFRWRSHADASLAGEYLARWGAYPIRIVHEETGYEPLDSLTTVFQGLRVALASPGRIFGQELLAVVDTRDGTRFLTVIGSTTLAPLPGVEAAIGVALHEPMESRNAFAYAYPVLDADGRVIRDTVTGQAQQRYADIEYRSRTWSARLSLDLATLILGAARPDRGGRLFAEAALLGWEDYPFYYPEKSRRIQFSAGLHLPTFGILDIARLQAERRAYPAAYLLDLQPFGGPVSEPLEAGPSHWWSGRIHLARALLPWLEAQGLAQCELRRKVYRTFYHPSIPGPDPDAPPQADLRPQEALWSFQARLMARL